MPRLFALDHNFPKPIVDALGQFQLDAELIRISDIDPRMADLDDWEVLLALHHHKRDFDGLITQDSSMLNLPRELSVLVQTGLTLIVAMESGDSPVKATGLLFAYLPGICQRTDPKEPQVWRLRAANRDADPAWDHLQRLAAKRNENPQSVFGESRLSTAELVVDPLS